VKLEKTNYYKEKKIKKLLGERNILIKLFFKEREIK